MKIKYLLLILAIIVLAALAGVVRATESSGTDQTSWSNGGTTMQESGGDESGGDEGDEDDGGSDGDEEPSDEEPSDEEPSDEEPSDEEPSDEEPSDETPADEPPAPGTIGDFSTGMPGMPGTGGVDTNLLNALAGYADYEVTYDTSITHAENTPRELRDLGVQYAEVDDTGSEAGQRALALEGFDLINILADRYQFVEDLFAADPDADFLPDDPDRTLNYFEPRQNPFSITDYIPDELRTETEGAGLEGTVDPELLRLLGEALVEANLRVIPISVIGVIKIGSSAACMYSIWGMSSTIWEGTTDNWWGFTVTCDQVSEDFVVLTLRSGNASVVRTFHVSTR